MLLLVVFAQCYESHDEHNKFWKKEEEKSGHTFTIIIMPNFEIDVKGTINQIINKFVH